MNEEDFTEMLRMQIDIQKKVVADNAGDPIVKLRYDDRVVIWVTQILPDRLAQIRLANTAGYVHRMIGLLGQDVDRLSRAVDREYGLDAYERLTDLMDAYYCEVTKYAAEIERIEELQTMSEYNGIRNENDNIV